MLLKELLKDIYRGEIDPRAGQMDISSVSCDSRKVEKDSLFVALKGSRFDGTEFIVEAVNQGARVVVGQHRPRAGHGKDVLFLQVEDSFVFLREIVKRFYGPFSSQVRCIGITGTNGKTTITYLMESILKEAGEDCGVMGTVNYRIGKDVIPSPNTTPDFVEIHRFLTQLHSRRIRYCVMEVSSHGLAQGRVDLIDFKAAVFTNLTSDHLDYHGTRENYFLAKAKLFTSLSASGVSVINTDDDYACRLSAMTKSKITTYGMEKRADVMAEDIQSNIQGSWFTLSSPQGRIAIRTKLIGRHNIYNILAAAAACLAEGIPPAAVQKGIERLAHVPGRLENVDTGRNFSVFIDYAHTEDALKNVLEALRQVSEARVIVVFGCGGDRDKTKRPQMGKVAAQLADMAIVTNDNPRSEDPQSIMDQIISGFSKKNYQVIPSREEAIRKAVGMAKTRDVVLIAGKGHEGYQIFKDKTVPFNEREIVERCLRS